MPSWSIFYKICIKTIESGEDLCYNVYTYLIQGGLVMKIRNISAAVIASFLVIPQLFGVTAYADDIPALPPSNSQPRHVDCTDLSEQAEKYYIDEYSADNLMALNGAAEVSTSLAAMQDNELFDALHSLMNDTQTFYPDYKGFNEGALAYYWYRTDAVEGHGDFISFYSDIEYGYDSPEGKRFTMQREHIWPKSCASYNQINGGADLHHLRPSVSEINQAKKNYKFGNINVLFPSYSEEIFYNDTLYAWANKETEVFECKDDVKGDVARILLYVYCRWQQPNLYSDVDVSALPAFDSDDTTNTGIAVIESLDTLLAWMEDDPVDTWEMERNDLVEQIQGNRNVFIDYPELAWKLFGRDVPEHIQTPSHSGCHHDYSVTEHTPSDCMNEGSLTKTCNNCGETRTYKIILSSHTDTDKDHFCDNCGERCSHSVPFEKAQEINEGEHIMLVCKADEQTPMSMLKKSGIPMTTANISDSGIFADVDTAVFCIESAENGFYLKTGSKYLSDDQNGNLYYADTAEENGIWQFEKTDDDSFILTCINSINTNKKTGETAPRILESYKGNLALYYTSNPDDAYKFYIYTCGGHFNYDETTADCTGNKSIDCECVLCGTSFTKEIPAKEHTKSEPVIENNVPATADNEGGYDTVIYCSECGKELSREHTVLEPLQTETQQIAPDSTLLEWAEKDYQSKTGRTVTASVDGKEDSNLTIALTDENGVRTDTYTIDTATGNGTDSNGKAVELPLTGIASLSLIIMVSLALFMLLSGFVILLLSSRKTRNRTK